MVRRRPTILPRTLVAAALAAALVGGAFVSIAPASPRVALQFPGRTDAGEWSGTWYYKSRERQMAFWFRETDGVPEMKVRIMLTNGAESLETDWNTQAEYAFRGRPGQFSVTFTERDADVLRGEWFWQFGADKHEVRIDKGNFTMYRAAAGRQMVVMFEGLERISRGPGRAEMRTPVNQGWTFHKASRRIARWGEMPF